MRLNLDSIDSHVRKYANFRVFVKYDLKYTSSINAPIYQNKCFRKRVLFQHRPVKTNTSGLNSGPVYFNTSHFLLPPTYSTAALVHLLYFHCNIPLPFLILPILLFTLTSLTCFRRSIYRNARIQLSNITKLNAV